jgi:hypothetical protein
VRACELVQDPAEATAVEPEGGGLRFREPRVGSEVPSHLFPGGPPSAPPSAAALGPRPMSPTGRSRPFGGESGEAKLGSTAEGPLDGTSRERKGVPPR